MVKIHVKLIKIKNIPTDRRSCNTGGGVEAGTGIGAQVGGGDGAGTGIGAQV